MPKKRMVCSRYELGDRPLWRGTGGAGDVSARFFQDPLPPAGGARLLKEAGWNPATPATPVDARSHSSSGEYCLRHITRYILPLDTEDHPNSAHHVWPGWNVNAQPSHRAPRSSQSPTPMIGGIISVHAGGNTMHTFCLLHAISHDVCL
jgi:hypothetical protein